MARLTAHEAMARAVGLARLGPAHGPNPRVGCVLLAPPDPSGPGAAGEARTVLAEGWHRGAGTPHAEAAALADAAARGVDVTGATAVVTLEPCHHTGRTGPCAEALAAAGVAEVRYAVADPNPVAAGGAAFLAARGVRVTRAPDAPATELTHAWTTAVRAGRPYVILKTATSLDGRVAAADGTSRWITGPEARAHAHAVRAGVDAIAVGTGTVAADDPALTARTPAGDLADHQPLRVVLGDTPVPDGARLRDPAAPGGQVVTLGGHDVGAWLAALADREVRTLLVEGGPTVASAFVRAGAVDELHAYLAPVLLGGPLTATGDLGVATLDDARRWCTCHVERLGDDVLVVARPAEPDPADPDPAEPDPADPDPADPDPTTRTADQEP